ncbi:MAG: hypothetical protein IAE93_16695 [Ignavibacteria bacterium]|nr:hypothetical protein [Ignavibacteria bacterium]
MQRTENQWESELNIISSIQVVIPVKLYLVCNQIAGKVGGNEFSIVTDIKEKDNQNILITDDFYIPKQRVNPSNIDYLPDVYNHSVCIHRHPDGCNGFSSTDKEYINQNFVLSLLYTRRDGFVNGIYNMRLDDKTLIQLPVDVKVDYALEEIDIEHIVQEKDLFTDDDLPARYEDKKTLGKKEKEEELNELESRIDFLEDAMYYNRYDLGNF